MRNFLQSLFGKKPDPDSVLSTILSGSPFEVILVPGAEAEATRARLLGRSTAPVILGTAEDADLLVEHLTDPGPGQADVLAWADALDVEAWLRQRMADRARPADTPASVWPARPLASRALSVPFDPVTGDPKPKVLVALFATPHSWEVPAHVRYGGWNTCPPAEVHVALHHRWNRRWGADIACMTGDVIECTVGNPPATAAAALDLAREQAAYCPDLLLQGTLTVQDLAETLVDARTWHFWWP